MRKKFYDFCFILAAIIYCYDRSFQNETINVLVGVALILMIINGIWDYIDKRT